MTRRNPDEWTFNVRGFFVDEFGAPKVARQRGWMPRIDLLEAETHLLIRVELAGVPANKVQIAFDAERTTLTVRGERPDELCGRGEKYRAHLLEIEEGAFAREINLPPAEYEFSRTRAQVKGGILDIVVPHRVENETVIVVERLNLRNR